ncbi:MAG: hypothetical protein JNL08_05765 [Planctomycetes bacterium]|nr:hypothetical protein [Planctomycetota bacterium]
MKELVTILTAVAAAAGVSVWLTSGAMATPVQLPVEGGVVPSAAAAPAAATPADWQQVTQALDRLTERIGALEQKLAAGTGAPLRMDAAPAAPTLDVAWLRQALDEVEAQRTRDRLAAMSDDELRREAQRRQKTGEDLGAAEAALRHLLERSLTPEVRDDVRVQLGVLQRQRGAMAAAESTLREVVDARGMQDATGAWAGYQLAWTLRERDAAAARSVADALALQAADSGLRLRARWTSARCSEDLGDAVRAASDYEQLLAQCADDKELVDVAKDVRWRLEQLRQR